MVQVLFSFSMSLLQRWQLFNKQCLSAYETCIGSCIKTTRDSVFFLIIVVDNWNPCCQFSQFSFYFATVDDKHMSTRYENFVIQI